MFVETNAGVGFSDQQYIDEGATILNSAKEVCDAVTMVIKEKEPFGSEYGLFREDHILYTYLHLAANEKLTKSLMDTGLLLLLMKR